MKGYNQTIGESVKIVDKLTAVDQQAAASAGEIAYAISISADSAQAAGVNINRLVGYLAAIREVTQGSTESIGIFADTLFTRIVNLQNKSLTGRSVPDDLSEIERILSNVGITLRDFGTILDEINVKWNTFTLGQQQTIATAFAGADQQEYFTALMEHYGTALNYAAAATNSAGAALNQYQQTYLTSAEAAQNRLTDSFERLSTTILNSEVITGVFDTGTGILSFLTQVIDWLGMIPTLAGTAAAALSFKNIGRHNRQNMPVYAPLTFADFAACA